MTGSRPATWLVLAASCRVGATNLEKSPMKNILAALFLSSAMALPAHAELSEGAKAPTFATQASLGGKEFNFALTDALKKGPVVLYFYPAAFTKGCTIEAHEFAEATDKFHSLGATVIGVSHDDIATLDKFSVTECRNKFAVAADPDAKVIRSYEAENTQKPGFASRISYVIAPDGKILYAHADSDPIQHVKLTMGVVEKWAADHKTR
jgi:peroxiredoxin